MFKSFFCYGVRLRTKSIITFRIVCFWFQFVEPAKQAIWQGEKFAQLRHAIYQAGFVQLILMVARKCRVCRSKPLWSMRA